MTIVRIPLDLSLRASIARLLPLLHGRIPRGGSVRTLLLLLLLLSLLLLLLMMAQRLTLRISCCC